MLCLVLTISSTVSFRTGRQLFRFVQADKAAFEEAQGAALHRLQAEQETLVTEIAEVSSN